MTEKEQEVVKSGKPLVYEGLRIRYGSITEDEPLMPCINSSKGFVEYLKRQGGHYIYFLSTRRVQERYPVWYNKLVQENSALDVGD